VLASVTAALPDVASRSSDGRVGLVFWHAVAQNNASVHNTVRDFSFINSYRNSVG
jgi:hypothetical protein